MTQNFVMAFGGTGARCMEAVAYLCAADAIKEPVHLLVVDPDETNGNVAQVLVQLRRYQTINRRVEPHERHGVRPFFSTPVNDKFDEKSFFWANPSPNTEFSSLIEYQAQGTDARLLLDLLYDESDLALTFEKGYIGRAHIGSLDLLRILQDQIRSATRTDGVPNTDSMVAFFRELRAATQQPGGARLMVIGSVFGGTGASGIPAVPPLLQSTLLSGLQKDLVIGCVQLTPYFSFPPGRPEDPDSAVHPLATQAALYHYSLTDTGYDRIYLVGAPGREQSNSENVVGGDAQKNRAHYVELASALAVAHFFGAPPTRSGAEVLACGSEHVEWDRLPYQAETQLRRQLVSFGTFCMLHANFLSEELAEQKHRGAKWLDDLMSARDRKLGGQEVELRELRDFARRFLQWATELQEVNGVDLFATPGEKSSDALNAIAKSGTSVRPFHDLMRHLNSVTDVDQSTGQGWYVEALSRASLAFCDDNYPAWGTKP
jgi:hypothetical protein